MPGATKALFGPAGPQPADLSQGALAVDCHFVAALQAVAQRNPRRLSEAFEITPSSVHVTCYPSSMGPANARLPARVAVDFPSKPSRNDAAWVTCMREAFERTEGFSSALRQRDTGLVLRWLTGHAVTLTLSGGCRTGVELAFMVRRFRAGDALVIGTLTNAYVVVGAEDRRLHVRGTRTTQERWLTSSDPWGFIYSNVTISSGNKKP